MYARPRHRMRTSSCQQARARYSAATDRDIPNRNRYYSNRQGPAPRNPMVEWRCCAHQRHSLRHVRGSPRGLAAQRASGCVAARPSSSALNEVRRHAAGTRSCCRFGGCAVLRSGWRRHQHIWTDLRRARGDTPSTLAATRRRRDHPQPKRSRQTATGQPSRARTRIRRLTRLCHYPAMSQSDHHAISQNCRSGFAMPAAWARAMFIEPAALQSWAHALLETLTVRIDYSARRRADWHSLSGIRPARQAVPSSSSMRALPSRP